MKDPIELTLFFTKGVSLGTWDEVGMLAREIAIYKALIERGVGVRFVSYGGREEQRFREEIGKIELVHNRWNLPESWYPFWAQRQLPKGGRQIFKSNQMNGADIALKAAQAKGAKFIARSGYLHSLNTERSHGVDSAKAEAARDLEKRVYAGADRIVVTTPSMQAEIQRRYGVVEDNIRVIPNYVQTDVFAPHESGESKKRKIIFVGRLSEEKNVDLLIRAMEKLEAQLILVGEGYLGEELRQLAAEIQADVQFMGSYPNDQLPDLLNESDIFVLASKYEGHPKALLEAMACGTSVIGSRVSGIEDIIRDGENGLLCDENVESIRKAIEKLLGDANLRRRLGERARKDIVEKFSLKQISQIELSLLEEMAAD